MPVTPDDHAVEPELTPTNRGPLDAAHDLIGRIGGFNGNGVQDLAPAATALALVAVAEELRALREHLESGAVEIIYGGSNAPGGVNP